MRRKIIAIVAALSLIFGMSTPYSPAYAAAIELGGPYQNPLIWADVPDPSVIRVGDVYYMTSTTMHMNPGVPIMKSYDLSNWEIVNYVYDILEPWDAQSLRNGESEYGKGSWASNLRYHNGTYYVIFSSSTAGKTYIYQTDNIEKGPWERYELPFFHDMSLLFDDDGRVYIVSGNMNIRLTELTGDATAVKPGGTDKIIIQNAISVTGRPGSLAEGAHIYKKDGYYYIFLIAWPQGQGRQQLVFRSQHIEGPYEGRVVLNDQGVAQGGIVDTPDGDWYGMLFQDHGAVGRIPYLVPVTWDDGWPVFGDNGKLPATISLPHNDRTLPGIVSSDEFYQDQGAGNWTEARQEVQHTFESGKNHLVHIQSAQMLPFTALFEAAATTEETDEEASDDESAGNGSGGEEETDEEASDDESAGNGSGEEEEADEEAIEDESVGNESGEEEETDEEASGDESAGNESGEEEETDEEATDDESAGSETGEEEETDEEATDDESAGNGSGEEEETDEEATDDESAGSETGEEEETDEEATDDESAGSETGEEEETDEEATDDESAGSETGEEEETDEDESEEPVMESEAEGIGQEIIINGDFESGVHPWVGREGAVVTVVEDEDSEGNHILEVTGRDASGDGALQDVTDRVVAGGIYEVSARVKYKDGPEVKRYNISIQFGDHYEDIYIIGSEEVSRGSWTTITGTYTIPPTGENLSKVTIFLETAWRADQNAEEDWMDFYVDDVSMVQVGQEDVPEPEPEPGPENNLVENWSFEDGLDPWYPREDAEIFVTDEEAASGTHSLFVTSRRITSSGPMLDMTGKIRSGRLYDISFKVKYTEGPATKTFIVTADYGVEWDLRNMVGGTVTRGEWTTISGTYAVPYDADTSSVRIFFETPWVSPPSPENDLMNFYLDDVVITELDVLEKPKPGEFEPNGSILSPVWQWNHNPDNNNWSLLERPGYLRLRTGKISSSIYDARNMLTQRTFGPESGAIIAMDVSNMRNGDVAGLSAWSSRYGYVAVKRSNNQNYIVMVNNSSGTPHEVESVALHQDRVYLKVELDYKNRTDKGYFYYSLDGIQWHAIGNTLQMHYNLEHFMGYRFALFNYATIAAGGYVDFDYFRVQHQLTGTALPDKVLNARLGNADHVPGIAGYELNVPVELDELPEGKYDWIEASFHIPDGLLVKDVYVHPDQVTGKVSYKVSDHQLVIRVTGDGTTFTHKDSKVFATIHFTLKNYIPTDRTLEVRTDYVRVSDASIVYNVHDAIAKINIKALDTDAVAKLPGYGNPLVTHKYGADPYALVYDGRVYLYMTSDAYEYDQNGNLINNTYSKIRSITVISSADLVNWTDHGEIPVAGPNGIAKWANNSWAPAIAHKNINGEDKFFLYFSNSGGGIGVLEGDSPLGPWRDPRGRALIDRSVPGTAGVLWIFDPAVLVDDDGSAYLYFGGGVPGGNNPSPEQISSPKTARVVRLGDDMISTVGEAVMIDAPYMFENSGIHKYGDRYYYTYSTNFSGTRPPGASEHGVIDYMVSDNPLGPFTHVGTILRNPHVFFGVGGNNHHAIFEFDGRWYIAYHAQTVGQALGRVMGYRSTHLNEVTFYDSGYIRPIQADREGVESVGTLNPYERIEAETIAWQAGISTQMFASGELPNLYVTDIDDGDWIAITNVDFGKRGTATLKASVAAKKGGNIDVRLGHPAGQLVGTLEVESTGGTDQWQTIETKLDRVTGVQTIFFVFQGEGKDLFEIDYWIFTERDDDPPGDDDDPPGGGDDDPPGDDDDPPGGGDDDPPGEDDDPPGGGTSPPPYYGPITPVVQIGIDGNQVPAGTLETFVVNGWKTTTLNVKYNLLQQALEQTGELPVLSIPDTSSSDSFIVRFDGGTIEALGMRQGSILVQTETGMYSITAGQLQSAIQVLAGLFDLSDVIFEIGISRLNDERITDVIAAVESAGMQLVHQPMEFTVRIVHGGQTVPLTSFGSYVGRFIAIPEDVDPSQVSTAILIHENGQVIHVPTQITQIDGQWFARINSMTNSTYALVTNQPNFRDTASHWAESYILDLGSRKIVNGIGDDLFAPNAAITRAEFAGIVARGLGLRAELSLKEEAVFSDVSPEDWFFEDVQSAYTYGLIDGYTDGTFRPRDLITREQAMVIIARAMILTGLDEQLDSRSTVEVLAPYEDTADVSSWAREAVAKTVKSGIVVGRTQTTLAPRAYLTRSEVAKMVHQLLELSDLI